jgi:alanine-glyoxylate transaminase/serine-glyoxylate transaminase/serine-pyruvate transaminase
MENLLDGIERVLLLGPGPSPVPESVYRALSRSTLGHMDPYFVGIMDEIKALLQKVMQTQHQVTLPLSGTGSAGMEACFVNLVEPGDRVLVLVNGVFGLRMQDLAGRLGANVETLEFEWGTPVDPQLVEESLRAKSYKIVALVHAETSTGVRNPASEIGELLKGKDTLYLLDTVTSLGGTEVAVDAWGVDALYGGSQKCLSCPPGLAPATFSDRAVDVIANRKSKVPNWYLDINLLTKYWEGKTRVYHHTAPINMLYGLYEALRLVVDEGLEHVYERHLKAHRRLVQGLETMGISMLVEPEFRLPMLNSANIPVGVDDAEVRRVLRTTYRIEIGPGLGPLAGKIWRFGLMGHGAREENVDRVLSALKEILAA